MNSAHDVSMETLLPPDAFDGSKPLLAQDIDDCLNIIDFEQWERNRAGGLTLDSVIPPVADGNVRRRVRLQHGQKYWVDFNPDIIDALDGFVRSGRVELGWLTTWGPGARALVEQAFDGKMAGGFVLRKMPSRVRGAVPAEWKREGLRWRIQDTQQPWIWIDDQEIAIGRTWSNFHEDTIFDVPHMMIEPLPTVGVTMDDVARIDAFISQF